MAITWHYECSICKNLIHPDDMSQHIEAHKASADWPGSIEFTRVDDAKTKN